MKNKNIGNDNELIEFLPLVKAVACHIYKNMPKHVFEFEDLMQIGFIGLMKAHDKHDPEQSKFKTYAQIRVRGEIIDAIREHDELTRTQRDVIKKEDREFSMTQSLDEMIDEHHFDWPSEEISIVDKLANDESIIIAFNGIAELPDKEQKVITLLYVDGMKGYEVAKIMGISAGRVTQLKTLAIKKLRKHFKEDTACII